MELSHPASYPDPYLLENESFASGALYTTVWLLLQPGTTQVVYALQTQEGSE